MKNWLTALLLGACMFGSLALTAAVPVLAQRAGAKAAVCKTYFGRGVLTDADRVAMERHGCRTIGTVA